MNTSTLTKAQEKSLGRDKNTIFYERKHTITDYSTGEILSNEQETIAKTSSEPDFIKLYYNTMLAFNNISDIPVNFLLAISAYLTWSNDGSPMKFMNVRSNKDEICKICKIKESMYDKYIARCKKKGLLFPTKYRGTLEVNPFFIAKGKWDSIKKLRCKFDFVDGTWKRTADIEKPQEEGEING